jgi:F-type H+-transporting ATPase subunit b
MALLTMVLVTAWSAWAVGQPKKAPPPGGPVRILPPGQRPMMPQGQPPRPGAAAKPSVAEAPEKKEEEEEHGPAAFNFTEFGGESPPFVAMLINFGILVGGYYLFGKDAVGAGLKARRDAIQKDIEEASRMRQEAEERAKKYQARLEGLEQEMAQAREALVRSGEAERDRIVTEAEAKAERMRKDAEFLVEQELKQIRLDLWKDAVDAAVVAAEELLKKRVTPADQERLAEEYLADLGKPAARAS